MLSGINMKTWIKHVITGNTKKSKLRILGRAVKFRGLRCDSEHKQKERLQTIMLTKDDSLKGSWIELLFYRTKGTSFQEGKE